MANESDRRPLASRDTHLAQAIARRLAAMSISPNRISQASMVAATFAGVAFWLAGHGGTVSRIVLLLTAALFCQARLLCNLFDGMVAVEGGKGEADGPFWNEFPDRIADLLILAGIGYGLGSPGLGWAAAALAILTAYTRELGRAAGLPANFSGPMAKQHRMAVVTGAATISIAEPLWGGHGEVLTVALWIVAIGAGVTVLRRGARTVKRLRERG